MMKENHKIILFCNEILGSIGKITISIHENYIYCDMIEVPEEARRRGNATYIVDTIRNEYKLPLRYSIVSDDCTGAKFWNAYTKDKEVIHLFGHTYEIKEDVK